MNIFIVSYLRKQKGFTKALNRIRISLKLCNRKCNEPQKNSQENIISEGHIYGNIGIFYLKFFKLMNIFIVSYLRNQKSFTKALNRIRICLKFCNRKCNETQKIYQENIISDGHI